MSPPNEDRFQTCELKILPAYAKQDAFLLINGIRNSIDGRELKIEGKNIILDLKVENDSPPIGSGSAIEFVIYHCGIRDYSLLFPDVRHTDSARAERLGLLYREAESCLATYAWLSYMLMSGAIFKPLLYHRLCGKYDSLSKLNKFAGDSRIITEEQFTIIDKARKYRNAIHANKPSVYVQRPDSLDASLLIEKLILTL